MDRWDTCWVIRWINPQSGGGETDGTEKEGQSQREVTVIHPLPSPRLHFSKFTSFYAWTQLTQVDSRCVCVRV